MRAFRSLIVGVVATFVVATALPAAARPTELVRLSPWAASVEVAGLDQAQTARVRGLWAEFVAAIPAQAGCLLSTPPRIEAKGDMRPRAAYAPASATLFVKPGDLDRLVVFHELGHHLDFTCGAAEEIGDELRSAQGIVSSKPWWNHGDPTTWPAEYFANAVAIALGENSRHDVTADTVVVVEEWMGRGDRLVEQRVPLILGEPGPADPRLA